MALDEDPDCVSIAMQYGTNTLPFDSVLDYELSVMYSDIIGGGDHNRKEFEGYGAPEIQNLTGGSGDLGGYLDVSFTVIPNKLDTTIYVQIAEADGNEIPNDPDDLNWSISSYSNTYTTTTNDTASLDVKTDTDYWVRIRYYNRFTLVDDVFHPTELGAGPYRSSGEAQDTLLLTNLTFVYTDGNTSWRYHWEYPDSGGNFQVRVTKDGGVNWDSVSPNVTYEGNEVWWGNFTPNEIIDDGTLIQFKIRRSNTTEPWQYTGDFAVGQEDTSNLSQPDVSTWSAQNVGETSARIRMYIHSFDNIAGQEYNYYWRYRKGSSGSWTTVRWSSTANNEADTKHHDLTGLDDDTYYEYQAFAVNTLGGTTQSGHVQSFTTDEIPLIPPENFTVSADGVGGFNLGWSTPSSGTPDSYRIDYREEFSGNWNIMESSYDGNATGYPTGDICHIASNGQKVDFRVRSNEDGSVSDWTPTKGDDQSGCGFGFE